MPKKKKMVKTWIETDQGLWERFKKYVKSKGMTLKHGHEMALKKMIGEAEK